MNKEHTGVSGVYLRRLDLTIHEVQKHRKLLNYFLQYYRNNSEHLDFPTPTMSILNILPSLCFVPCFLLSYTLCRVGELEQISLGDIKSGLSMKIKSSKSKHIRTVPAFKVFKPSQLITLDPATKIMVISYDHLKNGIKSAKKKLKIEIPDNALDCTHIFRHLAATDLFEKGVSLKNISNQLGHVNSKTTLKYIHSNKEI